MLDWVLNTSLLKDSSVDLIMRICLHLFFQVSLMKSVKNFSFIFFLSRKSVWWNIKEFRNLFISFWFFFSNSSSVSYLNFKLFSLCCLFDVMFVFKQKKTIPIKLYSKTQNIRNLIVP